MRTFRLIIALELINLALKFIRPGEPGRLPAAAVMVELSRAEIRRIRAVRGR